MCACGVVSAGCKAKESFPTLWFLQYFTAFLPCNATEYLLFTCAKCLCFFDGFVCNESCLLAIHVLFFFFLPSQERPNKEKKPSQVQEPLQEEADNRKW